MENEVFVIEDGVIKAVTDYGKTLTEIVIDKSVTDIEGNVFFDCTNLRSVKFEKGSKLEFLGEVFSGCENLTQIELPSSLKSICQLAFNGCEKLESIFIPKSVDYIDTYAFNACFSLKSIEVEENNKYYKSVDGNLYSDDGKILFLYAYGKNESDFTIPSGTEIISNMAFYYCKNLNHLTIPSSLEIVEDFFKAPNMKINLSLNDPRLNLKSKIPKIYSIGGCIGLNQIEVSTDNENFTSIDGNLYSKDETVLIKYSPDKKDKTFVVPSSVKIITDNAFEYSTQLTSVEFEEGSNLEIIGENAFSNCLNLEKIAFEDAKKLTFVCSGAFSNCPKIDKAKINKKILGISDAFDD